MIRKVRGGASRLFEVLGAVVLLAGILVGFSASGASAASDCQAGSTGSSGTCYLTTPNGHFDTNLGTVAYSYDSGTQQLTLTFSGIGAVDSIWLCLGPSDMNSYLNDPSDACTPPSPKQSPAWTSIVSPNSGDTYVFAVPVADFWFLHLVSGGNTLEATPPSPTPPPPGNLSVTKTIDGGTGSFTITVTCTGMSADVLTFSSDSTQTVSDIPDGTSCTATETDPGTGWSTTVSVNGGTATTGFSGTATIVSGETSNISFVNSHQSEGTPPGALSVTKTINGGTGPFDFTITVSCTGMDDVVLHFTTDSTQTVSDIPDATSCTATETDPGTGWSTTVSVNHGTATSGLSGSTTVNSGQTSNISFTNTFTPPPAPGALSVTKTIDGGTGPFSFTITVTCGSMAPDPLTFTTSGQTQVVSNIPAGTSCTAVETDPGAASWSTTVQVNSGSPTSGLSSGPVTIAAGTTENVAFVNTAVTTSSGGGSSTSDGGSPVATLTPLSGATTVHTDEAWAGSRPFELAALGVGLSLIGLGDRKRRRAKLARTEAIGS